MKIPYKKLLLLLCTHSFLFSGWSDIIGVTSIVDTPSAPLIGIDSSGNAIAVWSGTGTSHSVIRETQFNGTSWTAPTLLSVDGQNAETPQVTVNASGMALAVWQRFNGSHNIIQSRYFNGSVWETVIDLSAVGQNASLPEVGIDSSGSGVAVWIRPDGSDVRIQEAQFNGSTWSSPTNLSASGQDAKAPEVAMNPSGNALAIWGRQDGDNYIAQASYFNGSTWSSVTDLSATGQSVFTPQIAINASNSGVATWARLNGSVSVIQAAFFNGSTWSAAANLSATTGDEDANMPSIAIAPDGTAMAIWEVDSDTLFKIQAAYFNGTSWETPITLNTSFNRNLAPLQIGMDASGNALASWNSQGEGEDEILVESSRFNALTKLWSLPAAVSSTTNDAGQSGLAINANGNGVAIFRQTFGNNEMQSSKFTILAPPTNGRGRQLTNHFATQSEVFNLLTWTTSTSADGTIYRVRRNGNLISPTHTGATSFKDHNRIKGKSTTYEVSTTDQFFDESVPISIMVP